MKTGYRMYEDKGGYNGEGALDDAPLRLDEDRAAPLRRGNVL